MSVDVASIITAVAGLAPLVKEIIKGLKNIRGRDRLNQQAIEDLKQNLEKLNGLNSNLHEVGRLGKVLDRYLTFKSSALRVYERATSFSDTFPDDVENQTAATKLLMASYAGLKHSYIKEVKRFGIKKHFDTVDSENIEKKRENINGSFDRADGHRRKKDLTALKDEIDEILVNLDEMIAIAHGQIDTIVTEIMDLA